MKLYICHRGCIEDGWAGALLIAADSEVQAQRLFFDSEGEEPDRINEEQNIECSGKPRIIYDDYER